MSWPSVGASFLSGLGVLCVRGAARVLAGHVGLLNRALRLCCHGGLRRLGCVGLIRGRWLLGGSLGLRGGGLRLLSGTRSLRLGSVPVLLLSRRVGLGVE